MTGPWRFYLIGSVMLVALAGCGRSMLQTGERASWRHQAEMECLKSGAVKMGAGVVQIEPIEGPGMCGADFPLKVSVLGESNSPAVSYGDDMRPPAGIANSSQMPRWGVDDARNARPASVQTAPVRSQPTGEVLRWSPGAQPVQRPTNDPAGEPVSLSPPQAPSYSPPASEPPSYRPQSSGPRSYEPRSYEPVPRAPQRSPQPAAEPSEADDIPDDAILPSGRDAPVRTQPAYNAPRSEPEPRTPPALGPMRGPQTTAAIEPATLTPPATLACPLVSALDHWVAEGVQPAALKWFGSQVVTIKQISAYSCRGMVGAGISHISEHAFGNALDVAGFTLADGRKIVVRDGWHGSPEEQGFLHDVQLTACENFTTVLAPGYNAAHYDHIHVDLMRRSSGRRPCRPDAIPGEVAAAKARSMFANRHGGSRDVTGSIPRRDRDALSAIAGEDGEFDDDDMSSKPISGGWPIPVAKASLPSSSTLGASRSTGFRDVPP